jgi:hypothetical protein
MIAALPMPRRDRLPSYMGAVYFAMASGAPLRHGSVPDLDEDGIVTVMCETARILKLEKTVRAHRHVQRIGA